MKVAIFGLFLWLAMSVQVVQASDLKPVRLFILHSYEENHVCGQPQHDGIISELEKAGIKIGENLELQVCYMDTKQKHNTPEQIAAQADIALKQIRAFQPDILVTLDDNAFRTVGLRFANSDITVVFCGMNTQPEVYHRITPFMDSREKPGHNITGVYEKLHILDAFRVHSRMFPNLEKIMIFTDQSPTGRAIHQQIRLELENVSTPPCQWEIKIIHDWNEYKAEIHTANKNSEIGAIYPAALLLKDAKGNTYTAPEIFKWTVQHSQKPEIALNYAFTRLGLFGGAAVDFYAMGQQAGRMILRILQGESAGNIAIEEAERYALVFNLKRARQLGIKIPEEIIMAADEVIKE